MNKTLIDQIENLVSSNAELEESLKAETKRAKSYGYDSLCYRYMKARDAQAELEIKKGAYETPDQARDLAKRDELKFFSILDDLIGEHD